MDSPKKLVSREAVHDLEQFTPKAFMLRYSTTLFIMLCLQLFAGCTSSNLSRGLYEGIRVHNELQSSPAERFGKPESPDYPEYERMRNEQR